MKKFDILLFIFLPIVSNAQMHDVIWNSSGWTNIQAQNGDTTYTYFSSYLDFSKSSPPVDAVITNNSYYSIFYGNYFCDSIGQPRFFTNGHEVWHAKGPKFVNGDSLQPSWYPWFLTWQIAQNVVPGYFIVLPSPNKKDEFYLFALDEELPQSRIGKKSLLYTHLKGVDSDSTGYIAEKNVELIHRKYLLPIEAIKHANGRDWWILAMEDDSIPTKIDLNTFLLTPDGVEFVQQQRIANIEFQRGLYWHIRATPNGEKIVMNNILDAYVMNFDRCTGNISGVQYLIHDQGYSHTSQFAFSPNSKFWYYPTFDKVTQFDLEAADIIQSKENVFWADTMGNLTIVGYFTNDSSNVWPEIFRGCDLAYDGKIYLTQGSSGTYTSYISKPNEKGWRCKPIRLGAKTTCGLGAGVQHPNFRLGPIDGTHCDSLGLDNKPLADFWWFIDPDSSGNPLFVVFQDNSSYEPATWKWWFNDGTGQTSADTNARHVFPASGVYEVCMEVCNQNACDTICKLVQVGATVATSDLKYKENEVFVYPNPARNGYVTIVYDLLVQPIDMTVWNENGMLVGSQKLSQERNGRIMVDSSPLPSGMYFYRLRDSEGGLICGKFLVNK